MLQVRKNQIFLISEDDVLTEHVHQNFFCDELLKDLKKD